MARGLGLAQTLFVVGRAQAVELAHQGRVESPCTALGSHTIEADQVAQGPGLGLVARGLDAELAQGPELVLVHGCEK